MEHDKSTCLMIHTTPVYHVAWAPHGYLLASAPADQSVCLWDVQRGHLLHRLLGHTHVVGSVAWHPTALILASASEDTTVRVWDAPTGRCLAILRGHPALTQVVWLQQGAILAACGDDGQVQLWNMPSMTRGETLHIHDDYTAHWSWSADEQRVAVPGTEGTVNVYHSTFGSLTQHLRGHASLGVHVTAWSSQPRILASGGYDGTARIWDAASDVLLHTLPHGHPDTSVYGVAWSPNDQLLAAVGAGAATTVWNTHTGARVHTIIGDDAQPPLHDVVWSPDGQRIATAGHNGLVEVWPVPARTAAS